jgi:superfamily I DNA and/or RNA helicase
MNTGIFSVIKPIYDIHEGFDLIDEKKNSANDIKCININGKEIKTQSDSYYNEEEAEYILAFIDEFKKNRDNYPNIKTIGIITAYRAQENYLRRQLKKLNIKGVQLGTFDRFQGREYDLVIVSLVRTEKFGFTNDVRRMNVAFSRAKNHLLVFGNFDELNKIALKTSVNRTDASNIEMKENDFVTKTLIPKLYSMRENFVSKSDCVNELIGFLKENDYEQ